MIHTILITAYKNLSQLEQLVDFFEESSFRIYIHLDKKGRYDETVLERIKNKAQVQMLVQKYRVNWGGVNHLKAYLLLAQEALLTESSSYFHLITGQDFPIVSKTKFLSFFSNQPEGKKKDYIKYVPLPNPNWHYGGGVDRLKYYHFYDVLDSKRHKRFIRKLVRLQKKMGLERSFSKSFPAMYGGSTYWSLTKESLSYVVNYTLQNPRYLKRFNYSFCAEEIYFQTLLCNSPLKNNMVNTNLRYIDWSKDRGSTPVVLDMRDYDKLAQSSCLFARKFDDESSDLILKIKNRLW
ncbi:beta-1,6-N-acetylglucosaminyltransferase [Aestuariivivens sediminis]|uniref:beta-1,6-N-acetylglucosaminyltransferase n=1 Tax=Aestuariivivens sediminis TaxID=2913557 RepID=UPI001F598183|nr:beta-1,6-N-acetylglucosaminyltransferase [Aestuariivivens sediminis]